MQFKIKKYPFNKNRQSCLFIDLSNDKKPVYIYCAYLPANNQFYFSFQNGEEDKSYGWIPNPEKVINFEILEFIKKTLRSYGNPAV